MSPDEKLAVQTVVVEYLQSATTEERKTLLLDVLLSGDGYSLVHHVLSQQAAYAQRRADTLNHLLRALQAEHPPPVAEAPRAVPQAPLPMPGGL